MSRKTWFPVLVAAVVSAASVHAAEKNEPETSEKKQTHCPVMTKNSVNKNLYVDVKGYRIYVCCAGCIGKVKADADKYIKQMNAGGIRIGKVPEKETAEAEETE